MPKAYPLPDDPDKAAKVIRLRKLQVERVQRWRKRHPKEARAITRHMVQQFRTRKRNREERLAGKL